MNDFAVNKWSFVNEIKPNIAGGAKYKQISINIDRRLIYVNFNQF